MFHPYAILSRNVKVKKLKGTIEIEKGAPIGSFVLGFPGIDIFHKKTAQTIFSNSGHIKIDGSVRLGIGTKISNYGFLRFGNNVRITANSTIICMNRIEFDDDVLISWDNCFMDTDFHKIYQDTQQVNLSKPIRIGEKNWIGSRCLILKGSNTQPNTVIAAGSTISNSIESENVVVGNYGKILKQGITWEV